MIFKRRESSQRSISPLQGKRGKRVIALQIDKRQKFILGVLVLSSMLFLSEYQFAKSGIVVATIMAIITDLVLYWAIKDDLKENFSWSIFTLPFFYSLAFALFYFLIPTRLIFRLILTALYALGLYSLYLSKNIFIVSSIRTIALLSGARIVSFILTLLSYFFLTNTLFSLHQPIFIAVPLLAIYTYPLVYQALWSYNLQKGSVSLKEWAGVVTLCIVELSCVVWFWPSTPTVISLFLTGILYTLVGLSHVWFDKRLFRSVMWEYVWVGAIVFFVLVLFTSWGK